MSLEVPNLQQIPIELYGAYLELNDVAPCFVDHLVRVFLDFARIVSNERDMHTSGPLRVSHS